MYLYFDYCTINSSQSNSSDCWVDSLHVHNLLSVLMIGHHCLSIVVRMLMQFILTSLRRLTVLFTQNSWRNLHPVWLGASNVLCTCVSHVVSYGSRENNVLLLLRQSESFPRDPGAANKIDDATRNWTHPLLSSLVQFGRNDFLAAADNTCAQ